MTTQVKWIAKGMTFADVQANGLNAGTELNIYVKETEKGITMTSGEAIFGMPIDARLAIFYIRKLWMGIYDDKIRQVRNKGNELKDSVMGLVNNSSAQQQVKDDVQAALNAHYDYLSTVEKWIARLLGSSFAVTIDKSSLLKALSQPECEGLRFYSCMKNKANSVDANGNPEQIITLTTVGVDKNGKDLHFEYDPTKHNRMRDSIPDIENFSLCEEYPAIARGYYQFQFGAPELEPYVLYKYSMWDEPATTQPPV